MTESRDQQFFEALNNTAGTEDDDARTGGPDTAGAGDMAPPAAPNDPPERFAADGAADDPASGRHHFDRPISEAGGWGQPAATTGHTPLPPPPWPGPAPRNDVETTSPPDIPSAPSPSVPQRLEGPNQRIDASPLQDPNSSPLQGFAPSADGPQHPANEPQPERRYDTGGSAWPPRAPADQAGPPMPARPPQPESLGGQQPPPRTPGGFAGPGPAGHDAAGARPLPRPVPPEERTQFLSRDMLRDALPPNAAAPPPPGRDLRGSAPRPPAGEYRDPRAPQDWGQREPQPPAEPRNPAGVRPPEWDWNTSGGSGGAELRSEQISASELNVPRKIPSSRGWRKWLYYGSFKLINTGESPDEQLLRNLDATVAGHLRGTYSIVVLGGKGGVGKTTTTASVGSTFASLRKDKTIAIDANPDRASNLADRIDPSATNSYKDVLSDANLRRYSDIRSHVGMNDAGLDVLGNRYQSDRQPLTAKMYIDTHAQLQRFYSVLISDSGTDVDHQVVPGLIERADALIMVASTAPDGAKGAAELLDWAFESGYHRLLQRTVVVINDVRGDSGKTHRKLVDSLVEKFTRWVGPQRVFVVPFDPHIASAGVINISELRPPTRRRYLEITARVAAGFNSTEDRP